MLGATDQSRRTLIRTLLIEKPVQSRPTVCGWVRTRRDAGGLSFIELNDGSCLANLQLVCEATLAGYPACLSQVTTGASLRVRGELVASPALGQEVELRVSELEILGTAGTDYPLQKKRHSFGFLRTISQLRPRTNALGAVARVRSRLSYFIHQFLQERFFFQVHTPVITTSDCEGAGEMFTVTTLDPVGGHEQDFGHDFFGRHAGLTVSGQLQAEVYALALGRVYTFGPTFRAEHSHTRRHLAEFWMVEPEMAFCDLEEDMAVAEELVRWVVGQALQECAQDLVLFDRFVAPGLLARLERVAHHPFVRLTYSEAIRELERAGQPFAQAVAWGSDLQAEHERFLCEQVAEGLPVIVTDYPVAIKPFYMRLNADAQTVAAMDILVPGIGELIGGSQREERYKVLEERMLEAGIDLEAYDWYLDLRRFGTVPHAGFGLGFERLVQLVTGMANIRDVIPFPRTPGNAPC